MSWSWYIYTALPAAQVISLEGEYEQALAEFFEDHSEIEDEYAETTAGGPAPPSVDEVVEHLREYGDDLSDSIKDRLARCRSTVSFDYVRGDGFDSPLQVTILRFWLERLGPSASVMDWGDYGLELGEDVLFKLKRARSRGPLGAAPPPKTRTVRRRAERPGEVRTVRILDLLDRAKSDRDLAVDLGRAIASMSDGARSYLRLLVEEGAMADSAAVRKLCMHSRSFTAVVGELERAIAGITNQ